MRRILAIAVTALLATPALAGGLPLKPGGYVEKQVACAEASNATSLNYLADVLHSAGTVTTEQTVLSHKGKTYRLRVTLKENQSGASDTHEETVKIVSRTMFELSGPYGSAAYRWCNEGGPL